jgi:hypothetical protein
MRAACGKGDTMSQPSDLPHLQRLLAALVERQSEWQVINGRDVSMKCVQAACHSSGIRDGLGLAINETRKIISELLDSKGESV